MIIKHRQIIGKLKEKKTNDFSKEHEKKNIVTFCKYTNKNYFLKNTLKF